MASDLQLSPRADSTQSTLSVISLNRTTEKEGIVVDEGFCDVEDPSFGDAADRLAVLEKEEEFKDEASSPQTSRGTNASRRPPIKGASSRSLRTTSSMRSSSSRSFGGVAGSKNLQTDSYDSSSQSQGALQKMDSSSFSISGGDSLPPGSPFGNPSFQSLEFHNPSMGGAAAKLDSLGGVDDRLLSGLKSLSHEELNVYMKLTKELKKECQSLDGSPKVMQGTKSGNGSVSAEADHQLLEEAIRKLRALLPPSAIRQLEGHASYGLVDIVQATTSPAAPPPTPASPTHRRPAA